ncbi:hypothetical protein Taro_024632 [Colocasia esculenta]|uniref:ATPase AAA-type core domain-containing protein n=1 Tax=Colocasia esculenta TaxID=4460 RepID=A0A843VKX5_COLES|nr:hypothetical protein [Colocasia esculenta]
MFIGDGAKLVRDAFLLAKEKSPCIIFIDEIDAIGTKRFESEVSGDREDQALFSSLIAVSPIRDPTIEAHLVERAERDDDEDEDPRIQDD